MNSNDLFDYFKSVNWKVFLMTFGAVFIIVALQHIGLSAPRIENPLSKEVKAEDIIEEKLSAVQNTFSLHRENQGTIFNATVLPPASAFIVIDYDTGEILAEKNAETKLPVASLTKVMTAVVTLDLANPDDVYTVSEHAASIIPTKIGVVAGQKMAVSELLHAAMMTSANDAVEVLEEGVNATYNRPIFVEAMNKKAQILQLTNTHFSNPQGFDTKENYSSAWDLAILARYALSEYPLIADISKKDYHFLPRNNNHKQYDLYNWNGLIGVYPNVEGIKIGNTGQAGTTTIVIAQREGKKILVVLLGTQNIVDRDLGAAQLLDYGFAKSKGLPAIAVTEEALQNKYKSWKFWN